jgi:hypothetical protein
MPIIELSTALVAAGSGLVVPFVNKVLEKSAQRLGGHVDEHLATLFTRAHEHLAATGREAQSVEPKLLKAVVENAPYETDPTLADYWAALLANAADPAQRVVVQLGFAEVLRQLTPTDAAVIDWLYQQVSIPTAEDLEYALPEVQMANASIALNLTTNELATSTDNLLRLRLCTLTSQLYSYSRNERLPAPYQRLCPSAFGFEFRQACAPPAP